MIKELKEKAKQKGRTLASIADEIGVHRSVLHRWEKQAPKSFQIYERLKQAIEKL